MMDEKSNVFASPYKVPRAELYEDDSGIDPVYQAKARVLNEAIQEIGMGKYQWYLFAVAGFGWFADSVWHLLPGIILFPVLLEFSFDGPFLSLAANVGLFVGAVFWGLGCDIWGRRWPFNITLFVAGIFGLSAGGAPNFITLASLFTVLGVGVGGNLPVDSAVFLGSHQYLLTILSLWWSLGQVTVSLIAWRLIGNFSCSQTADTCHRSDNMGWRYMLLVLGGMTLFLWGVRFFFFDLFESPRFLVGIGGDAEAVAVIQRIATYNSTTCSLSVDDLLKAGGGANVSGRDTNMRRRILSTSSGFALSHVKALFSTRRMAWSTGLLIAIWGITGLAYTLYGDFLPYLLTSRGATYGDGSLHITYRNQVILSAVGVPGAFLAGWAVELPHIGRKGTLAISSGVTGVFLFATTRARTSNTFLGWNCGYVFFSNIMGGVLCAISPETFPAIHRGTGNGLVSTASGVFGILGPVIALHANLATAVPVYIAGALVIFAGLLALLLPYEPRGKTSI